MKNNTNLLNMNKKIIFEDIRKMYKYADRIVRFGTEQIIKTKIPWDKVAWGRVCGAANYESTESWNLHLCRCRKADSGPLIKPAPEVDKIENIREEVRQIIKEHQNEFNELANNDE